MVTLRCRSDGTSGGRGSVYEGVVGLVVYSRHGAAVVSADGYEGGAVAVAVALGSVPLGVAQLAVNLAVRSVTGGHGVQRAVTLTAVVAGLVPFLTG